MDILKEKLIEYYSQNEIKEELVRFAKNREVVARYSDYFGKRPDVLLNQGDVIETVKQGAVSFHSSEELWQNPLLLDISSKKKELDKLRIGWDFIIDIDCRVFDYSKIVTELITKALENYNIEKYYVKFSGNKGFHIGVPFKAFPSKLNNVATSSLFPEAPRNMALYLKEMLREVLINKILDFENNEIESISKKTGKKTEELLTDKKLEVYKFIEIDTVLLSNRHLFRMPYSLHEKGYVSLPIKKNKIRDFEKERANIKEVTSVEIKFLERFNQGEASGLLLQAYDKIKSKSLISKEKRLSSLPNIKIEENTFPPCIINILNGLEDGRKRAVFVLINFLSSLNWDYEQIERLLKQWNLKNKEELNWNYIKSQLDYHKKFKKKIPPPNCREYYKSFCVCTPNQLCDTIKNPLSYAAKKYYKMRAYQTKK